MAALLAVLPIAMPSAQADRASGEVQIGTASQENTVFGAYMAAGHAEAVYDFQHAADLLDRVLEAEPDDPLLQRRGMLANLHAGRIERAAQLARPQIIVYPSEVDIAALTLAAVAMRNDEWERAVKILKPARRIALARFSSPILAAWAEFGRGDTDAAIESLEALRTESQAQGLHDFHAALIFMAADRHAEAEALLAGQTDNLESVPIGVVRAMARAKLGLGESEAAEDLLRGYDALNPGVTYIEEDIASLESEGALAPIVPGPKAGAAEAFVDLARQVRDQAPLIALRYARLGVFLDPQNDLGRMVTAAILERLQRHDAAIVALSEVREDSAFDWDARMQIADNLISLKRDEEAIEHLEAMAKERPEDIDALDRLGYLMRARERFAEGTDYYDRAVERIDQVNDQHWRLFYFRGITLERTQRWPEAEADFRKSLELKPDDPYVLNYLGYSWIDQGINIEEGMDMIRTAVSQRQNDGNIVDSLGWAHYRLGEYEDAVIQLERAVQLRPSEPVINDHLGDAYWKVGRKLEATYQWRHALSLEPDDDLRATIERKLEEGLDAVEAASGNN
ncbi:MAG: tetratricopeptide repeat protein [Alphaproteobacteria bacterium]|nr:tetratricopeptide repeat protein [Alphaproteobacteria bacterium]